MDKVRATFEHELKELIDQVLAMGITVMDMLKKATYAFEKEDMHTADEVVRMDDKVDKYNIDIEIKCLQLIATQQPMAKDLRIIASTMRIISDIERMGDYTVDVVKFAKRLMGKPKLESAGDIKKMAGLVEDMLKETLDALTKKDLNMITKMIQDDENVDAALRHMFDAALLEIEKKPLVAREAIYLLLMARYLERIADHITNVGERVYYMETGEMKELHV
ncbi:MAG: phosphate transport system protein [Candidatus Saganbacteria bacterium]|uniref:Phosphate-specific transport system accessory protein PhoU n=1 Tax=Candidatus Saganbacteria bacterium TaxID=2575572 RepID=A0A833NY02_UNCSA|nr:MAG: phosphate transport system protein [Candidatus Saganbacteria bacterium]